MATTTPCTPPRSVAASRLRANLHKVKVFCEGKIVADHDRVWAKHQSLHDPVHLAAAKALLPGAFCEVVLAPLRRPRCEIRALADYDILLGVDGRGRLMATTARGPARRPAPPTRPRRSRFLTRALKAPTLRDVGRAAG